MIIGVVWVFRKALGALVTGRTDAAAQHLKAAATGGGAATITVSGNSTDPNTRLVGLYFSSPGNYNFGGKWGNVPPDVILYPQTGSPFTTTVKVPTGTHFIVISCPNGVATWSIQVSSGGQQIATSDTVDASNPLQFTV